MPSQKRHPDDSSGPRHGAAAGKEQRVLVIEDNVDSAARAFCADDATKGVFLVALSGYALPEDLQRAHEAGFDRHLAKPPSIEKIEEALASGRSP